MTDQTPASLLEEYGVLEDWLDAENKRYAAHIKPARERMDALKSALHEQLLALGSKNKQSIATDFGTAYLSTVTTPKVADRDKFIDAVLEKWDEWGNEMLQVAKPQVDAVRSYQDNHEGQLPPGVEVSSIVRVNIRRS